MEVLEHKAAEENPSWHGGECGASSPPPPHPLSSSPPTPPRGPGRWPSGRGRRSCWTRCHCRPTAGHSAPGTRGGGEGAASGSGEVSGGGSAEGIGGPCGSRKPWGSSFPCARPTSVSAPPHPPGGGIALFSQRGGDKTWGRYMWNQTEMEIVETEGPRLLAAFGGIWEGRVWCTRG